MLSYLNLPIAWSGDGSANNPFEIIGLENLTQEQRDLVAAAIAAYDPLPSAQSARILEAAAACDAVLDPLAARFGRWESATWKDQLAEANAILAGDTNPTIEKYPHIGGIIAETGETWHEFAMAVQANSELWTPLVISAAGQRQRIVAQIKACTTVEEVAAVDVTIRLPG